MADFLLEKSWRVEERVKELLEQACAIRLTDRSEVYQPWDEYVRRPRNDLAHGRQLTVDADAIERAHQATWHAIKSQRSIQNRPVVIESKPATFMVSKGLEVSWQVSSH